MKLRIWSRPALLLPVLAGAFSLRAQPALQDDNAGDTVTLERMDVLGQTPTAYGASIASSSTKLAIPLLENSQNIQVIPRGFMDDQGVLRLEEVLRNVAGVIPGGLYSDYDSYRIRGFDSSENTFIDGLRENNGMNEELFSLQQVDVVKGPASTLFGQAPLGGVVNIVSKRPVFGRTFTEVGALFGSEHLLGGTFDANVRLSRDGRVMGRFLAVHREEDSFVDYADSRRHFLAGSVSWKATPDTLVTVYARTRKNNERQLMPLTASGTILPNPNGMYPLDRYNGEPGRSNHVAETSSNAGFEIEHHATSFLTLRQKARFTEVTQTWDNVLYPYFLDSDGRTLYRYPNNFYQKWRDISVDTHAELRFNTGRAQHRVLTGVDLFFHSYDYWLATPDFRTFDSFTTLDLFEPVYGGRIPVTNAKSGAARTFKFSGFYAQDHIRVGDQLHIDVGGRFGVAQTSTYRDTAFTPHVGAVWEVRPGVSLFANRGESFSPQPGSARTAGGDHVKPEEGVNYEAGIKTAARDGRLTATIAYFDLTRQNVATDDPQSVDPRVFIVTGEQRSRGVEVDGRFSPLAGWELSVAYAYTDARITEDTSLPVGERTVGVPLNAFNLWTRYTFQSGALKGLGVAVGQTYYSKQVGDSTYSAPFNLPPYGLTRLAAYYTKGNYRFQVNVENLFDRVYFPAGYDQVYVVPGSPRSIRFSVVCTF